MNLHELIDQYVTFRKGLGERCDRNGRHLRSFGRMFSAPFDVADIRLERVGAFLAGSGPLPRTWPVKHSALPGFFRYAVSRGYITTAPLPIVVPKRPPAFVPYIYFQEELRRLLDATGSYQRHRSRMEPVTVSTIVLLLYGAGLRVGEALALRRADVDFDDSLLTVRNTKFFKTRLIPIGPVLVEALRKYSTRVRAIDPVESNDATLFTMRTGEPVSENTIQCCFRRVCNHAGIRRSDGARYEPRLQDLRHSFAVHRLTSWYREGLDVQSLLPHLSVYMGHVSIASTQVYLSMTTELLQEASTRFERYVTREGHDDKN